MRIPDADPGDQNHADHADADAQHCRKQKQIYLLKTKFWAPAAGSTWRTLR
jgi:hypothetical protein